MSLYLVFVHNNKGQGGHSRWTSCVGTATVLSFQRFSFISTAKELPLFFSLLGTPFPLLFLSPLLLQIFLHGHFQAEVVKHRDRENNLYNKGKRYNCQHKMYIDVLHIMTVKFLFISPPGLLFLHISPAALHEF